MFQKMAVIAQLEHNLTVQRVNNDLASAKARGAKLGKPKIDTQKVKDALRLYDSGQLFNQRHYSNHWHLSRIIISKNKRE